MTVGPVTTMMAPNTLATGNDSSPIRCADAVPRTNENTRPRVTRLWKNRMGAPAPTRARSPMATGRWARSAENPPSRGSQASSTRRPPGASLKVTPAS